MLLSAHFSLAELSITQVRGVDNTPPPLAIQHLKAVAVMLEAVRVVLGGKPIIISSGYRCPTVNTRVGGALNSAHLAGYAADFICPAFGTPLEICETISKDPMVRFDQIIEEGTWVHLSVDPQMRGQVLTKNPAGGYLTGLRQKIDPAPRVA